MATNRLKTCVENCGQTAAHGDDIGSLYKLVVSVSDRTIADPTRFTVQPQYHTIGIADCVMTLQGHPRSKEFARLPIINHL